MLWTRDSIKKLRQQHAADFSMSEQQIYKWWWDQTRKRSKRQEDDEGDSDSEQLYAFQDEFGGYSSRLRFKQNGEKRQKIEQDDGNVDTNLCALLGIDVEGIAMRIAMGEDADMVSLDQANDLQLNSDMHKRTTQASSSKKQHPLNLT